MSTMILLSSYRDARDIGSSVRDKLSLSPSFPVPLYGRITLIIIFNIFRFVPTARHPSETHRCPHVSIAYINFDTFKPFGILQSIYFNSSLLFFGFSQVAILRAVRYYVYNLPFKSRRVFARQTIRLHTPTVCDINAPNFYAFSKFISEGREGGGGHPIAREINSIARRISRYVLLL